MEGPTCLYPLQKSRVRSAGEGSQHGAPVVFTLNDFYDQYWCRRSQIHLVVSAYAHAYLPVSQKKFNLPFRPPAALSTSDRSEC